MQAAAGVIGLNAGGDFTQHVAGIQTFVHLHDGDAGELVTGFDTTLNGCGTAPARQQRGMYVQTAMFGGIEHALRQNQAVGHHHHYISVEALQLFNVGGVFEIQRLIHRNPVIQRDLFNRAGLQFFTAPGRTVGLGIDSDDIVVAVDECLQVNGCKLRRAGKQNTQGHQALPGWRVASLCFFSSLSLMRLRFSGEM